MKLGKDFGGKNLFWMLLGGAVFLSLIALVFLLFLIPGMIAQKQSEVDKNLKAVAQYPDVKGQKHVTQAEAKAKQEKENEQTVHENAWLKQRDLTNFPEAIEKKYDFRNGALALEVAVQKEKPAELPVNNPDEKKFQGILTAFDTEWIEVEGKVTIEDENGEKKVSQQKKRFYRTPKVKVTIDAGAQTFGELSALTNQFVAVTYNYRYFGDPMTDTEQSEFGDSYRSQLRSILQEFGPLNERKEPLVQLKGWTYRDGELPPSRSGGGGKPGAEAPFHYVDRWDVNLANDISVEAWLAQEDLWIQREVFRLVKKANDYVANFQRLDDGKDKNKARFQNPYWNLELTLLDTKKIQVKIGNRLNRPQQPNCGFQVQFLEKEASPRLLRPFVNSTVLWPAGSKDPEGNPKDSYEETQNIDGFPAKGIFAARQVLTWETAAVKRIDLINVGTALPHRLADRPLAALKTDIPAAGGEAQATPPPKGQEGAGQTTAHGLVKNRYLQVTTQARRVPVAVVLIVDQMHVSRVQTAFADSALRFLTNQVLLHRYPFSVRPPDNPGAFGKGIAGGEPAIRPQVVSPTTPLGTDEPESNMELVIYGVVTLYERYPPRLPSAGG